MWKTLYLMVLSLTVPATSLFGESPIRLIVRGDDMGSSHAANLACMEAFEKGVMTSVEVMVPTPWFPEAVQLLKDTPDLDVGVHLTLTSEWDGLKWRPLTWAPSITDSMGYFYPRVWPNDDYPADESLKHAKWKLGEIEQELRAQIKLAVETIPQVSHVTGHMGIARLSDEVRDVIDRLAMEFKLAHNQEELGIDGGVRYAGPKQTAEEKVQSMIKALEELGPGTWVFVDHPGLDTPEMRAIGHKGYGEVAVDRQGVTTAWTDKRVREIVHSRNIKLVSYCDLASKRK
jgi:predicted glycoside hydrolase/deacetylase ChbG (UPF0249 family)